MAYGTYFRNRIPNQTRSVMTRLTDGLNEYNSPAHINDNNISEMLDVLPYYDESIQFHPSVDYNVVSTDAQYNGKVYAVISDSVPTDGTMVSYYTHIVGVAGADDPTPATYYITELFHYNVGTTTAVTLDVSSYNFMKWAYHSMCTFFTENERYACYANSRVKKLLYYNYSGVASGVRVVSLPFYPKKIVSHANRIFAADITNKIWWCRGGDITSWYGAESDDDYLVTEVDMKATAYTLTGSTIDVPRPWMATITKQGNADTYGNAVVVGTDSLGAAQTETLALVEGVTMSFKSWKTITSFTTAGWIVSGDTTKDHIKVGIGAVGNGYVQSDAGYWTLEQERVLVDIAVLANVLYIWSDVNIYAFRGYDYDTFTLDKIISDIGCANINVQSNVAVANNTAYFIYSDHIYEFDGNNYPRVISHPVLSNGSISNGILGGIIPTFNNVTFCKLAADRAKLILYQAPKLGANYTTGQVMQSYLYVYYFEQKTWWYNSGMYLKPATVTTYDYQNQLIIPQPDRTGFYVVDNYREGDADAVYTITNNYANNDYENPYIVTKAFNTSPSDQATLTAIIMQISSDINAGYADLSVYYSLLDDDSSWTLLKTFDEQLLHTYVENLEINLIGSEICRASHYRLKIVVSKGSTVGNTFNCLFLHNMELRYRIIGRSR